MCIGVSFVLCHLNSLGEDRKDLSNSKVVILKRSRLYALSGAQRIYQLPIIPIETINAKMAVKVLPRSFIGQRKFKLDCKRDARNLDSNKRTALLTDTMRSIESIDELFKQSSGHFSRVWCTALFSMNAASYSIFILYDAHMEKL